MKARRFLLAAVLSVVGCAFAIAGCGETADDGHVHDYEWEITTPATCLQEGERKGTCKICGNKTEETLPKGPHTLVGEPNVITAPTCMAKGSGTQMCSVCNTEQPVELDYAPHTLTHHDAVVGDCNTDGTIEYWSCSVCLHNFSDEAGKFDVTSLVVPKESYPHNYDDRGVCTVCGAHDPSVGGHICTPIKVSGVEANCKDPGVVEHYKCNECGKLYKDAAGREPMTEEETVIPVSNDHNPSVNAVHQDAIKSTSCLNYGRKESWDCKVCGRHFADKDFTKELFEVGADGVCSDTTLQDPKSDVHTSWNAHSGEKTEEDKSGRIEPTCTSVGWAEEVYECNICGLLFRCSEFDEKTNSLKDGTREDGSKFAPLNRDEVVLPIDPSKHSTPEEHKASNTDPSACGNDNVTYKINCWECTYCHKLFSDQECKTEVDKETALNFGKHQNLTEDQATNSTCKENGHPHCWTCESCGEHFDIEDPAPSTDPLSDEAYNLPLIPHSYTKYKYNAQGHWYVCEYCGEDEKDEYGAIKMEDHVYEDGIDECLECNYNSESALEYFLFDESGETASVVGLASQDGKLLFEDSAETVLTIPEVSKTGKQVTAIADSAFSSSSHSNYGNLFLNKITKIVIPASITTVGNYAFYAVGGSNDKGQIIGSNVKEIEFASTTSVVSIGNGAFGNQASMEKITLPKNLKAFSAQMLINCSALTTIVMPDTVQEGSDLVETFRNCKSLKTLDLWCLSGKSYSLGKYAMNSCSSLEEVYLPKNLTNLDTGCMGRCTSLTKIHYEGTSVDWNAVSKETESYNAWNYLVTGLENDSNYLDPGYVHSNNN